MKRRPIDPTQLLARLKRLELSSTKLVDSLLSGNYRSVFRGPGVEFDEVREYVDGDDARLIDWNVSSRMDATYTKIFREERELTLFLIADVSASMLGGAWGGTLREAALLTFAVFTFAAVKNNDRVGALLFTDRIESRVSPIKGRKHGLRLIQDALTVGPVGEGSDLSLALRTAGEALTRRGICVIISDFKTTGYWKELTVLARHNDVIAVRINNPADLEFPPVGLVHLEDPESGRTIPAAGFSTRFASEYQAYWEAARIQWLRDCRRRGVSPLELRSDADPAQAIIRFFRRRRG